MRWEGILPRRSLRVLLVENDDSTRHIVTALLRKCNYRVAGVADGIKAWEMLMEMRYNFDLVLTEVVMPSLSGIELLSKIVSAEECKNVPVIMMSTHDSVNLVLKCMRKGAVDFLVKPVRKNELRNLWQHVWRRHCSNSYMNALDDNTASNQISANIGGRSKTEEHSDERSDAQSSGSKRDMEIENIPPNHEEPPQVEDSCISKTDANVDPSNKNTIITVRASVSKMDGSRNPKDYEHVGISVNLTLPSKKAPLAVLSEEPGRVCDTSLYGEENFDQVRSTDEKYDDPNSYCKNNVPNESRQNMTVFVEPRSNGQCCCTVLKMNDQMEDGLCETATVKPSYADDESNVGTSSPWKLSLRSPRPLRSPQPHGHTQLELKEKHVFKQSIASAFSRYGDKRILSSPNKTVSELCIRTKDNDYEKNTLFSPVKKQLSSPPDNRGDTAVYFQVSSTNRENTPMPSLPIEIECAVQYNMENSTLNCTQIGFIPLPIHVGAIPYRSLCAQYRGIGQTIFYQGNSSAPEKPTTQLPFPDNSLQHNNRSSSLEFHHHEVIDHTCQLRQAIDISELGDTRELCNPSGSCSQEVLRGSGSNGSGGTADGIWNNMGIALESGNVSGVQSCNKRVSGGDHSRREAALMKFRLKRKDRCFEKKVRYHSRKKLAEKRPRIKGQFVKQKIGDSMPTTEADN